MRKVLGLRFLLGVTAILWGCTSSPTATEQPPTTAQQSPAPVTQPTEPATQPTTPATQPSAPATQPTAPATPPSTPSTPPATNPPAPTTPATPAAPEVFELTVRMLDHKFEPANMEIPLGAKVKLTIVNEGEKDHDFNILGVYAIEGKILPKGQSEVHEFVANQAGEFQIVCSQRGHKERGMVATLVVK